MLPADERFSADHLAGTHIYLGLVVEDEFAGDEGAANVYQGFVVAAHAAILLGVEDVIAVLAGLLRLVHRLVSLTQQLVGVDFVGLRVKGDAEAGGNLEREVANRRRCGRRDEQPAEHRHAGGNIRQVEENRDEFVAAEAGEGIAFTQRHFHARSERDQQLVADLMPVFVVDRLEAVEIEVGDRQ